MRGLALLPVLLALPAGCRPAPGPPAPAPPATAAPQPPSPPRAEVRPAPPAGGAVTARAAGPYALGMTAGALGEAGGLRATPLGSPAKGVERVGLRAEGGLTPALVADLRGGRVIRLLVRDPAFATADGVRVGAPAKKLRSLYGTPRLVRREGALCAEFAKAPGLAFCFAPGSAPVKDWPGVVKRGLSVVAIDVRGQPGAK